MQFRRSVNGVGTNFGVRGRTVGQARLEGPRAGDGVLGEGQPAPPRQLGGLRGSAVSSLSRVGADPRPPKVFLVF